MKSHFYLSQPSRFGGFAAILMSLMPCVDNCAQNVQTGSPQGATAPAVCTRNLAAVSHDGEFYAVATLDGRIKCGSTHEGARTRTLHQCNSRALVFSPDSCLLGVAGECAGGPVIIKVWRVADGAMLCKVQTGVGEDPHMRFSPDGLLPVSTCEGSRINFWQLPKGTLKGCVTTSRPVLCLAFSKDGKAVIAVFADGSVQRFPVP